MRDRVCRQTSATARPRPGEALRLLLSRLGPHGDVWLRLLDFGARLCPWFMEPVFLAVHSLGFFLGAVPLRRALAANMRAIHPGEPAPLVWLRVLRVFWNFACCIGDGARQRSGQAEVSWEIHGIAHLLAARDTTRPFILLTAHMGSYEVAAPLFYERCGRPIHTVRAPEPQQHGRSYAADQRKRLRARSDHALQRARVADRGNAGRSHDPSRGRCHPGRQNPLRPRPAQPAL